MIHSINANNASHSALKSYCRKLKEELDKLKTLDSLNALDDKGIDNIEHLVDRLTHVNIVTGIKEIEKLTNQELVEYFLWLYKSESALSFSEWFDFSDTDGLSHDYYLEIDETKSMIRKQIASYDRYLIAQKKTSIIIGDAEYFKIGDRFMAVSVGMYETFVYEINLENLIKDLKMHKSYADFEILNSEIVEKILSNVYKN